MRRPFVGLILLLAGLSACIGPAAGRFPPSSPDVMPDVSGLAWAGGDAYLVVHDAKTPDEDERPRVGLVEMAPGAALRWTPLDVDWPGGAPSHDLESIARVPGTSTYLLVESGDGGSTHQRIFVVELDGDVVVREVAAWPDPVYDVEGSAVFSYGGALYFVFAERAHGEPSTEFAWGRLSLGPFRLDSLRRVAFENPLPGPDTRAVSAIEVDAAGRLYVAGAYDPGDDGGPFRSAVWEVGRFDARAGGEVELVLSAAPTLLGALDGLKVEGLTSSAAGLVVGTDDEDFGGTLRRLPR